ncbi:MAG: ATP-binding cassette domain-containing protein [Candidatus Peribacteria bacterium]|nr:MAG: ATP-binding cassette domain-containing protein [Candidatus Peribacteria bacterium]
MSLHIRAGKKNAIIGHSGGGKSTIVKMLLRLYDYQSGSIQIDGQDLKSFKIDTLYQHIGYLPQEPAIFDGTIRENLEYALNIDKRVKDKGKSNMYDDAIMWKALKDAQVDDMVRNLEHGLDTEVGEKGIKLSGGEKQRLAIARIFLKNLEIIILDEPTSALDSISEDKITASLNELMQGKTSIVIAHRLQTVMNADNIVIIENGKIADEGTHTELLKKSKIYKKLVDLQHGRLVE